MKIKPWEIWVGGIAIVVIILGIFSVGGYHKQQVAKAQYQEVAASTTAPVQVVQSVERDSSMPWYFWWFLFMRPSYGYTGNTYVYYPVETTPSAGVWGQESSSGSWGSEETSGSWGSEDSSSDWSSWGDSGSSYDSGSWGDSYDSGGWSSSEGGSWGD